MSGVLSAREICLRLGGTPILDGVSFEVQDRVRPGVVTGQVVGLLGPSGVGKTRLLRIIAGLDPPDKGQVLGLGGKAVTAGEVGVVFQHYPLLRHRTVLSNLVIAGVANGLSAREAKKRADELLARFRLGDRGRYYPAQLSGGQRQRVAIAQQLVVPKRLLLLDEPFSGLDPQVLEEVMKLIIEVANMHELNTLLVVTHDLWAAMIVSDTLLMLGRARRADGAPVPGARIQASFDLVERGLAWRADIEKEPAFAMLEREVRERFKSL